MSARFGRVPVPEPGAPRPLARISVLIPARNEAENLARLLPSLRDQSFPAHEIIVIDDGSEDGTADRARELGATVLAAEPLPAGWYGKPWACQQGAEAASGDWLLFLDADTELEPEALFRIGHLGSDPGSVHGICPYHEVKEPYEELSAFFNVIMLLGMNAFTIRGAKARRIGLCGQALFISDEQYRAVGGHASVRSEVLENFHLANHLSSAGYTCRCYLGWGTIRMRMFPGGLDELVAGWSKGFVSGADNTPKPAMIGISLWLSALIMSAVSLTFLPLASLSAAAAIGGFYALCALQCLYLFRNAGSFRAVTAVLFPVGLVFYLSVFYRALQRRKSGASVSWKGRDVV